MERTPLSHPLKHSRHAQTGDVTSETHDAVFTDKDSRRRSSRCGSRSSNEDAKAAKENGPVEEKDPPGLDVSGRADDCADVGSAKGEEARIASAVPAAESDAKTEQQGKARRGASRSSNVQRWMSLERRESVALLILATLAVLFALSVTRAIMLPIMFAILLSLTLRPIVRRLRCIGIPDQIGAGMTLFSIIAVGMVGLVYMYAPAREWMEDMPENVVLLQQKVNSFKSQLGDFEETSDRVKELAAGDRDSNPVPVQITQSGLSANMTWISSTGNVLGSTVLVLCLSFFLLAFGDRMLNNVLHLLNTWSEKKRTVELVYDIERGIASYLFTVTVINIALGIAVAIAMWLLQVPNPALWGVMATTFNYVPIFGAIVGFAILSVVSLLSFDSMAYAIIPPLAFVTLTTIEGNLITPSILGKSMSLNPIMVFLALIFWGWIWGIGGAFLAVPMLAVAKLVCERFERTKPLAVLIEA